MSQEYTKLVIDCETHTQEIIPMTEQEIAQLKLDTENARINLENMLKEQERIKKLKESAIQKLMELGLTREEAEVFQV